jgi:glycosyltransferase involved in cell wall biosynthesis
LIQYLGKTTIGIVYIPKTPAYNCQPPTKLFEFIVNGIPVLATSTREIARFVNDANGVLIDDNAQSFADGLDQLIFQLPGISSEKIKESARHYLWENLIKTRLLKIIGSISTNKKGY